MKQAVLLFLLFIWPAYSYMLAFKVVSFFEVNIIYPLHRLFYLLIIFLIILITGIELLWNVEQKLKKKSN